MTETIWDFLSNCETCGEPHRYRQVSASGWTWEHPNDGHHYRPPLQPWKVAELRAAWEQAQEKQPA